MVRAGFKNMAPSLPACLRTSPLCDTSLQSAGLLSAPLSPPLAPCSSMALSLSPCGPGTGSRRELADGDRPTHEGPVGSGGRPSGDDIEQEKSWLHLPPRLLHVPLPVAMTLLRRLHLQATPLVPKDTKLDCVVAVTLNMRHALQSPGTPRPGLRETHKNKSQLHLRASEHAQLCPAP